MGTGIIASSRLRSVDALQQLRNTCVFYANYEVFNNNQNTPQVGGGIITTSRNSVIDGIIGNGITSETSCNFSTSEALAFNMHDGLGNDRKFLYSCWVKLDNTLGNQVIISFGNNADRQFRIVINQNNRTGSIFSLDLRDTSQGKRLRKYIPSSLIPTNEWAHLAVAYNGDKNNVQMDFWINGVKHEAFDDSDSFTYSGMSANPKILNIGSTGMTGYTPLKGVKDEDGFFITTPTQKIIDTLYNNGSGIQLF